MSHLVRNLFRFAIFMLVQVYVLDRVPHLHRFIVPYLYFVFLLWLPFATTRLGLLAIGFGTGLVMDAFRMTPGLHTAACLLVAYARPFVVQVLIAKDSSELQFSEPSPRAFGWPGYLIYAGALTLLHHFWLTLLQWFSIGSVLDLLAKVLATVGISMLLILGVELLFPRNQKYRTNTG